MLSELKAHHREIARLKFLGHSFAEIAQMMNTPTVTVKQILQDPLLKAHINQLGDKADTSIINVRKRLAQLSLKALDIYDEILEPETNVPWAVKNSAAKDILDRNGYAAPQQVNHMVTHFTKDDLMDLLKTAQDNGAIIDIPSTSIEETEESLCETNI